MKLRKMILVMAWVGLLGSSATAQISDSPLSVEGGKIRGAPADVAGVAVYKAVPFAAPRSVPIVGEHLSPWCRGLG
ncbi:hypothetical protein ACVWZK_002009 [Bradyrhizobium sp. GM0.4]